MDLEQILFFPGSTEAVCLAAAGKSGPNVIVLGQETRSDLRSVWTLTSAPDWIFGVI